MTDETHATDARSTGRALIIHPVLRERTGNGEARSASERLQEAIGLAGAIDLEIAHAEALAVNRPRPATLLGKGALETFAELAAAEEVDLVVIDAPLSPVQQRNLEQALGCKVIDRTALILEIFGARARTKEGRLQVELAHLTYQRSRLVRSWTHLERQRGGFGFLGGPGESQLEIDRRLIGERIGRLKKDLETVRKRRALQRRARRRVPYPVTALVGYTNAGKSTLFNRLTTAQVRAEDMLFATLDPTMRAVRLASGREIILADTVGFISDLPTDLVAAFRATLEEVLQADIIVHVRDIADPASAAQKADVLKVLAELGVLADGDGEPNGHFIEALNKIDRLDGETLASLRRQAARSNRAVALVSARTGEGCDAFLELIDRQLAAARRIIDYDIDLADGAAIAWLYRRGEVLSRRDDERVAHMRVSLDAADAERFGRRLARAAGPNAPI
ncbi:MAG: GTPase HflX [Alphaproteobacteria bacterium]|nr:GTPase HflX [Alphaproteobacteria bacterium]